MSNYPNMSYCAFENTHLAMGQLLGMMSQVDCLKELGLSRDELRAFHNLKALCDEFLEGAEGLESADEEYDGQPDEAQEWESFDPDC